MEYRIAQVNIAKPKTPLDSGLMRGFTSRLAEVNHLAEAADGFIWRLTDEEPAGNDELLVNLAVWQSIEALQTFSYTGAHLEVFRSRDQWFEKPDQASYVLWWIPAGHIPTVAEAFERLDY